MKIVQLYDVDLIRSVMLHEDILPTIIDDTWDGSVFTPDVNNEVYLGCVVDGQLFGVYRLHWISGVCLQGHAHILKDYRKEYSVKSCHEIMRWILENIRRCEKVDCWVPFVYPNVKQFLAACGFSDEGVSRNSFMLNGQLHDQWLMGITKKEMQELTHD